MHKLLFQAACLLLACQGAGAQEATMDFDRANASRANLCRAPVRTVTLSEHKRLSWTSGALIVPDVGSSTNPNYVWRNLRSRQSVKATCIYRDERPRQTMEIPSDIDRCVIYKGEFFCFYN